MTTLDLPSTVYDRAQFDDNFPAGIEDHYWFQARNAVLGRTVAAAERRGWIPERAMILEVGCGTGIVVAGLHARGCRIRGVEIGMPPRILAPQLVRTGLRAQDLDPGARAKVDALMFLDVIEHVPDDAALIADTLAAFPRCRAVFVTVPARPELWSAHDRYYGHYRRYSRRMLSRTLEEAGLTPRVSRYMFRSLYLAAAAIRASGRERNPVMKAPANAALHRLGAAILKAEDAVLRQLPLPGLSVLGVGTRDVT